MPNYKSTYIEKGTDIDTAIEIIGGLLHQLNYLMKNLDSENVKRINTNSTVIKSGDGSTEINGNQLLMFDGNGNKRLQLGYNKDTGKFEFTLYKSDGVHKALSMNQSGDAVFSGDIETTSSAYIGDNIYLGDQDEDGMKKIVFFGGESSVNGTINAVKGSNNFQIGFNADVIYINNGSNYITIAGGSIMIDGYPVITARNEGYVTIDGVDYQVQWR